MNCQPTQSELLREQLLAAMKSGEYAESERLPRESVLADKLGISRTLLRDVLASLEREGFITRRHGVGTIINHHVLNVQTRIDIEVEFMDMIRRNGHEPGVAYIHVSESFATEAIARKLHIEEDDPILSVTRLCTADGRPAIYCEDVIAKAIVKKPYTIKDLKLPFHHFLKQFCDVESFMDLTDVRPTVANEKLSEIFAIPVGSPLLNLDEVDYDIDGKPVFCSNEYFADGFFCHTVVRKRL